MIDRKSFVVGAAAATVVLAAVTGGMVADRIYSWPLLDKFFPRQANSSSQSATTQRVVNEESTVIDVANNASPAVVTVSIKTQVNNQPQFDPFSDPFGMFRQFNQQQPQTQNVEQDIGSGFIIDSNGLVVTNKHVVSDTTATYKVVTNDNKTFDVQNIYRDPTNDLAILKINSTGLKAIDMGDSNNLKVGQFVVAIGTALGEFRHTVTTGVVSGLGRGITAGSPFEGSVEQLDNVIQTDAAINPGNSGGPLLNLSGQVIGINTAVSQQGQNIGFAIPINVVKTAIDTFNKTGQFNRPFLGVEYQMIDLKTALQNSAVQGAYVQSVVADSPAAKAGVQSGDILTKIDGQRVDGSDPNGLSKLIANHKVGDKVQVELWRNGNTQTVTVTLEVAK